MDARNFTYMFYGFAAAWGILALYVFTIANRESKLRKQLDSLKQVAQALACEKDRK